MKLNTFQFELVTVDDRGEEIDRRLSEARSFLESIDGVLLEIVVIPGGNLEIEPSNPKFKGESLSREYPQHHVTVPSFLIGKYPITQAQWQAVASLPKVDRNLNRDPSNLKGENHPVENVSWYNAAEFCQRLSHATRKQYRLPSQVEWEYACRAGTTTPFHFGATLTTTLANYDRTWTFASEPKGEYRKQTTEVGSFPPNAFGLYDMHGNVWEWCAENWDENYQRSLNDRNEWKFGDDIAWRFEDETSFKRLRGGSWNSYSDFCRSDDSMNNIVKFALDDDIGFRVLGTLP